MPLAALTDREINRAAVTWGAYAVAIIATMVAFTKPIAFVTSGDAGGRLGPGGGYAVVASAWAVLAMVLNAREHLLRQNPWRRGATLWSVAIVVGPLASLILLGIVTWGRALPLTIVVLVGVGVVAGRRAEERWSGRAGL